jgi:hypothetical protein
MSIERHEERVLKALLRLEKEWPKSLWVFAANGRFIIMRTGKNGEHVMTHDGGGADPAYIVTDFNIPCDGGDW